VVTLRFLAAIGVLGLSLAANAQEMARPEVPENIKAPDGEKLLLQAHASGFQIYTCQTGGDGKPAWGLKGPEARLYDRQGMAIGHHHLSVGPPPLPTWKHNDGSEVSGKMMARADSPDADSIPWLLLTATSHSGKGILSAVTSIQRIHTNGGQPPSAAGCDEARKGLESKSAYIADYYFYAPAN
jgi:Protein of unknown function (DUF3455)